MIKKTGKIKSGVLSEKPITQVEGIKGCSYPKKSCRRHATFAPIEYSGDGILIEASANGNLPMGDIYVGDNSSKPSPFIATVSKRGEKKCKIPSKEIWFTDYTKSGSISIKDELSTDSKLNEFIKKKCGFSL